MSNANNGRVGGCEFQRDFTTGSILLVKFQGLWEQTHEKSIKNVDKVEKVITKIDSLDLECKRSLNAFEELTSSYKSIPKLKGQIETTYDVLKFLEDSCVQIEDLLLTLKNFHEDRETENSIKDIEANCKSQIHEQRCNSQHRADKLRIQHLQRVEAFERQQQLELEERRRILERTFEEEKNRYLKEATTRGK